jgi:hypothetical protein
MLIRVAKNVALFSAVGFVLSLAIFGLASAAPTAFGWLTVPFWLLPAVANLGAHDVDWRLFLLSGTLSYGVVAFLISRWRMRRIRG